MGKCIVVRIVPWEVPVSVDGLRPIISLLVRGRTGPPTTREMLGRIGEILTKHGPVLKERAEAADT
jgi:hypothetical protein